MKSAVIAAVVAALVSASGTYAASQYVITKITQIRPGVLAQIRSKAPTGAAGPAGAASTVVGPEGKQGAPGIGESIAGPPGLQGPEGKSVAAPVGETGPRGERGESITGPPGASSVFVVEARVTELRELYVGQQLSTAATCPEGSTPIGGSFQSDPENVGVVIGTYPNEANGWATSIEVTHPPAWPADATFVVWADCVR